MAIVKGASSFNRDLRVSTFIPGSRVLHQHSVVMKYDLLLKKYLAGSVKTPAICRNFSLSGVN